MQGEATAEGRTEGLSLLPKAPHLGAVGRGCPAPLEFLPFL